MKTVLFLSKHFLLSGYFKRMTIFNKKCSKRWGIHCLSNYNSLKPFATFLNDFTAAFIIFIASVFIFTTGYQSYHNSIISLGEFSALLSINASLWITLKNINFALNGLLAGRTELLFELN